MCNCLQKHTCVQGVLASVVIALLWVGTQRSSVRVTPCTEETDAKVGWHTSFRLKIGSRVIRFWRKKKERETLYLSELNPACAHHGCAHGACVESQSAAEPYSCRCEQGWHGRFCEGTQKTFLARTVQGCGARWVALVLSEFSFRKELRLETAS